MRYRHMRVKAHHRHGGHVVGHYRGHHYVKPHHRTAHHVDGHLRRRY